MRTATDEAEVHCWEWDYPMEKNRKVLLLCGDGDRRIRDILESQFQCTYLRCAKFTAGRLEQFRKDEDTCYVVIVYSDWVNSNKQLAVLAHEVNHLVFTHFKDRGYHIPVTSDDGNDEELFNGQAEYWLYTMLEALNAPAEEKAKHIFLFNGEEILRN